MKRRMIASFLICTLAMGTMASCSSRQDKETNSTAATEAAQDAGTEPDSTAAAEAAQDTGTEPDSAADSSPTQGSNESDSVLAAEATQNADTVSGAALDSGSELDTQNVGVFSTTDVYGNPVDESIFADYDLTLVNVFATWCGPCIKELPELNKLSQNLAGDSTFQVIGFVLDAADAGFSTTDGTDEAIEKAQLLAEETGCTFPFVIPDTTGMNGHLAGINAVPESFFVDSKGNIVGDTYVGARDYETWESIVKAELANIAQGAAQ